MEKVIGSFIRSWSKFLQAFVTVCYGHGKIYVRMCVSYECFSMKE
jgi:hypothetical protein